MQMLEEVTGIVIKVEPIGEYDKRVVLLTKEKGKLSAFAKGARRPNNRLLAGTNTFCMGTFMLYAGKNSYNLQEVHIKSYFEELRTDYLAAYYGMYFMEIADYYCRENNDEIQMLNLLILSLRALVHPAYTHELVQSVYEIKTIVVNGEFPGLYKDMQGDEECVQTVSYIVNSSLQKLYTFSLSEEVLLRLSRYATRYRKQCMQKHFNSLEIIKTLG
ncbi:MAG: DNA repair protein RecO [Lachnospiraceae bacterium]